MANNKKNPTKPSKTSNNIIMSFDDVPIQDKQRRTAVETQLTPELKPSRSRRKPTKPTFLLNSAENINDAWKSCKIIRLLKPGQSKYSLFLLLNNTQHLFKCP